MARPKRVNTPSRSSTPTVPSPGDWKDFALKDELYYHIQMQPDVQPLATIEYQGVEPPVVAWTRTLRQRQKFFHTPLGHRDFGPDKDDPLRDPNLGKLIIQGVEWVAPGRASALTGVKPAS